MSRQLMRSSNPALNEGQFQNLEAGSGAMTIQGTVNKSFILLLLVLFSGSYTWATVMQSGDASTVSGLMMGGLIVALISALVTVFKKTLAPITAPIYALAEGLVLGAISAIMESQYPGLVSQAVLLTSGTLIAMLLAYTSGAIQVTENFKLGLFAATGGIFLFYLASMVFGFFGVQLPLIASSGIFGIGFSVFVVSIAALNLVMDFDFIENASKQGAPKYMEWYGAFGLMVTLIWLYLEILRLLAKLRER